MFSLCVCVCGHIRKVVCKVSRSEPNVGKCKIKFRRDHVATKWDEGYVVNVHISWNDKRFWQRKRKEPKRKLIMYRFFCLNIPHINKYFKHQSTRMCNSSLSVTKIHKARSWGSRISRRAQRTKSKDPKGLQIEVGAQRAPRLIQNVLAYYFWIVKFHTKSESI